MGRWPVGAIVLMATIGLVWWVPFACTSTTFCPHSGRRSYEPFGRARFPPPGCTAARSFVGWPGLTPCLAFGDCNRDGSRAWAVSDDDVYQDVQLLHSFGPGHAPKPPVTDLAVAAQTGTGKNKGTAFLTVTRTSPVSGSGTNSVGVHYWWITASTNGGQRRSSGAARWTPPARTA